MKPLKWIAKKISFGFSKEPEILFFLQRVCLRFAYNVLDLRMATWVIRRPEWLRKRFEIRKFEPAVSLEKSASLDIAKRIIATHHSSSNNGHLVQNDSMWNKFRDQHYDSFLSLIEAADSNALREYLSQIFRTKTVNGYTYGSTMDDWPHRWHYLPITNRTVGSAISRSNWNNSRGMS